MGGTEGKVNGEREIGMLSNLPVISAMSAAALALLVTALAGSMGADVGGWDYLYSALTGAVGGYLGASLRQAVSSRRTISEMSGFGPADWLADAPRE